MTVPKREALTPYSVASKGTATTISAAKAKFQLVAQSAMARSKGSRATTTAPASKRSVMDA